MEEVKSEMLVPKAVTSNEDEFYEIARKNDRGYYYVGAETKAIGEIDISKTCKLKFGYAFLLYEYGRDYEFTGHKGIGSFVRINKNGIELSFYYDNKIDDIDMNVVEEIATVIDLYADNLKKLKVGDPQVKVYKSKVKSLTNILKEGTADKDAVLKIVEDDKKLCNIILKGREDKIAAENKIKIAALREKEKENKKIERDAKVAALRGKAKNLKDKILKPAYNLKGIIKESKEKAEEQKRNAQEAKAQKDDWTK